MAESVDALDSGSSGHWPVGVRVSSRAPSFLKMDKSPNVRAALSVKLDAALFCSFDGVNYSQKNYENANQIR